jgi:hypothetical protein
MCLSFPSDGFKYLLEIGLVSNFVEILLTQILYGPISQFFFEKFHKL